MYTVIFIFFVVIHINRVSQPRRTLGFAPSGRDTWQTPPRTLQVPAEGAEWGGDVYGGRWVAGGKSRAAGGGLRGGSRPLRVAGGGWRLGSQELQEVARRTEENGAPHVCENVLCEAAGYSFDGITCTDSHNKPAYVSWGGGMKMRSCGGTPGRK